jgi:hypothetical protein
MPFITRIRRQRSGIMPIMDTDYLTPLERCDKFVKECIKTGIPKYEAKQKWLTMLGKESLDRKKFFSGLFTDVWANNGGV